MPSPHRTTTPKLNERAEVLCPRGFSIGQARVTKIVSPSTIEIRLKVSARPTTATAVLKGRPGIWTVPAKKYILAWWL